MRRISHLWTVLQYHIRDRRTWQKHNRHHHHRYPKIKKGANYGTLCRAFCETDKLFVSIEAAQLDKLQTAVFEDSKHNAFFIVIDDECNQNVKGAVSMEAEQFFMEEFYKKYQNIMAQTIGSILTITSQSRKDENHEETD